MQTTPQPVEAHHDYVSAISESGKSIYDGIPLYDPSLWIPLRDLESILSRALVGQSLAGLPLRTRSRAVREQVCLALGYPVPDHFRRTRPRFPGQRFDVYVQKSRNLQIWNEPLAADRRYVLIRVAADDRITAIRVVTGIELAKLDTTGTLTKKYQAKGVATQCELVSELDTEHLLPCINDAVDLSQISSPSGPPRAQQLLSIQSIYNRLGRLIETEFPDAGADADRDRGARLHALVCRCLGYATYHDNGQYPDVRHQLLEVKLQTSTTIDLGLVRPDDQGTFDLPWVAGRRIKHADVRYAVFFAESNGKVVWLKHVVVSTGEDFLQRFPAFQGKVVHQKNQIRLPLGFFPSASK